MSEQTDKAVFIDDLNSATLIRDSKSDCCDFWSTWRIDEPDINDIHQTLAGVEGNSATVLSRRVMAMSTDLSEAHRDAGRFHCQKHTVII